MAIAIGSQDDAIVDVENVFATRENRNKPKEQQHAVMQVVFHTSKEVRVPVINSTLIIGQLCTIIFPLWWKDECLLHLAFPS